MLKPIRYSHHAEIVIRERQLEKIWIEDTIRNPDWSLPDPIDADVERRFRSIAERDGRVLRVACVEHASEIRVISAFIDRGARRPQ